MNGVETILNVLGSVALLLWGVRMVRTGLTRAFGAALRRAIAACSRNRFTAFLGGIAVTGLLQSSTATSLLVSSFAGRGLMLLSLKLLALAAQPLRNAPAFMALLQGLQDEYVIAVVVGTLATWFVHSSLSTVLLVMSFAGSGLISPPLALALVIGANVGGALAPYMAQSGS